MVVVFFLFMLSEKAGAFCGRRAGDRVFSLSLARSLLDASLELGIGPQRAPIPPCLPPWCKIIDSFLASPSVLPLVPPIAPTPTKTRQLPRTYLFSTPCPAHVPVHHSKPSIVLIRASNINGFAPNIRDSAPAE